MSKAWIPNALSAFFTALPEDTRAALTVQTPRDVGRNYLLHLSKNNRIRTFKPREAVRTLKAEDQSIARVCTAPTLLGCLLAYASAFYDHRQRPSFVDEETRELRQFLGGWTIYGIPFTYAIKPSSVLLPDVDKSDEHWLVASESYANGYASKQLGKLFFTQVKYRHVAGQATLVADAFVEVSTSVSVPLNGSVRLTQGYWHLTIENLKTARSVACVRLSACQKVDERTYLAYKQTVASCLSFESFPPSASW